MAQTIPDIEVTTTWLDLNTASGIAVGTAMKIQNKGNADVLVYEGTTLPAETVTDGVLVPPFRQYKSDFDVPASSLKIWVRTLRKEGKLNVR